MLFGKLLKRLDDYARVRAIVHVDARRSHPGLQVVNRQWNVLGVRSIEYPNFTVARRLRHTVAVVVKQDPLLLRVSSE